MEHLINPRVKEIQISGIRRFFNRVAQVEGALSLTIGQPDFTTPEHIKEAGIAAIRSNQTTYTPNAGILPLREAAAQFVSSKYGLTYNPQTEIITTIGASQAIDITLRTIVQEGSEVILPVPVYPGYEPIITMLGGQPVFIDTRSSRFKMSAEALRHAITPKTRCLILPYPSNPTGTILNKKELEAIASVVREHELFVISDEIYSELVYGSQHCSIASLPGMREKTIVINGLSKSHAMTGWRIGFLFAPEWLTQHILKVHQYNVSCASSVSQYAALEALEAGVDDALPMRMQYENRRDYVYQRLLEMGIKVEKPEGAFYLFPDIKDFGLSSFDFAIRLL